jgi:hypothetical protein
MPGFWSHRFPFRGRLAVIARRGNAKTRAFRDGQGDVALEGAEGEERGGPALSDEKWPRVGTQRDGGWWLVSSQFQSCRRRRRRRSEL